MHALRIAGHGRRIGLLFVEADNAAVVDGFDDAELGGQFLLLPEWRQW